MKNPEKVPFIGMLETFLDRRLLSPEQDALDAAYEDYVDMLHSLTARSLRPPLDLLHELARLQSRLMRLQAQIVEKESPQASLLESALLLTNFEIRLSSPGFVIRPSPIRSRSKSRNPRFICRRSLPRRI